MPFAGFDSPARGTRSWLREGGVRREVWLGMAYVYALTDMSIVHYIGYTEIHPEVRLYTHCQMSTGVSRSASKTGVQAWIAQLREQGRYPRLKVLLKGACGMADERDYINYFLMMGAPLKNKEALSPNRRLLFTQRFYDEFVKPALAKVDWKIHSRWPRGQVISTKEELLARIRETSVRTNHALYG